MRELATCHRLTVQQIRRWCDGVAVSPDDTLKPLPAKAGRLLFRLKGGLRLKPPEAAPAESRLKARWAL